LECLKFHWYPAQIRHLIAPFSPEFRRKLRWICAGYRRKLRRMFVGKRRNLRRKQLLFGAIPAQIAPK
jgi:hypothetical protein